MMFKAIEMEDSLQVLVIESSRVLRLETGKSIRHSILTFWKTKEVLTSLKIRLKRSETISLKHGKEGK